MLKLTLWYLMSKILTWKKILMLVCFFNESFSSKIYALIAITTTYPRERFWQTLLSHKENKKFGHLVEKIIWMFLESCIIKALNNFMVPGTNSKSFFKFRKGWILFEIKLLKFSFQQFLFTKHKLPNHANVVVENGVTWDIH